jgi:periplasmic protein TonB
MRSKPIKSIFVALVILTGAGSQTFGQATQHKTEHSSAQSSEPVYMVVEKQPEFPGGQLERSKFFAQNLNIPKIAKKSRRVIVSFIVNTDGSLQDVVIKKGLSPEYDQEVLRVAQSMPNWIPGSQSGKLIRVKYILPVEF